ncbi:MAG: Crp/Fnr family transcriptional regulator [Peptostreptococcus sp.]|uniref:Crp/Fnr family transcriptional regulator n=1 Tax=Peptostreptococcus sp. TaxID=1262 RepID=UPI002FC75774
MEGNNCKNTNKTNYKEEFSNKNMEVLNKHIKKLKNIKLFEGLTEENLYSFLVSMDNKIVQLKKGEILFNEGDFFSSLCILLDGEVLLTNSDEYGNRNIIDIVKENQMFAEVFSFTSDKLSPVTAQANLNSTVFLIDTQELLSINNDLDNEILTDKTIIVSNLLNIFANKNLILLSKIEVISRRNIREKIMHFLELQREKSGKNIFEISYSRKDMADFLGVDRSALSRELSRLREEGIIDYDKNSFKII